MKVSLKNLGTVNRNLLVIEHKKKTIYLWFSYETIIAFKYQYKMFVRQNNWGITTGKFLDELQPDKKQRLSSEIFEAELIKILNF